MSMFGGGGGGTNLPPLIQRLNIVVAGQTAAVNALNAARQASGAAVGGMTGLTNATNLTSQAFLSQQIRARTMADSMRQLGSLMQYTIIMPLMNVGIQSVRTAMQFEDAMAKIRGLVGATTADMKMFEESILGLAGEVGKSPIELADALYYVTSAGFEGAAAMDVVEASAKAAAAGLGETATIADTLTSVLNAYSTAGYKATQVTDILVAAVREGKAEPQDMAGAMGKIVPVAATFGVSVEDVAASIAAMTRQGAVASTSAIYLRQVLNTLLDPTVKAEEALRSVGMSAAGLRSTIQEQGLLVGLEGLYEAFNGNAEAIATVFGNVRAMTAVFSLMGPNLEANRQIFDEMSKTAGDTDAALAEMQKTAGFKMKQAAGAMGSAMVKLGNSLFPLVSILAKVAKGFADAISAIMGNKVSRTIVLVVGGFAALAAALVTVMRVFTSFYRMKLLLVTVFRGMGGGVIDNVRTYAMLQAQMANVSAQQMALMGTTQALNVATNANAGANVRAMMSERDFITSLISKNNSQRVNIALTRMASQASIAQGSAAKLTEAAVMAQARSYQVLGVSVKAATLATAGFTFGLTAVMMALPYLMNLFKKKDSFQSVTQATKDLESFAEYARRPINIDASLNLSLPTGGTLGVDDAKFEEDLDTQIEGMDKTWREYFAEAANSLDSEAEKINFAEAFINIDYGQSEPAIKKKYAEFFADIFNIDVKDIDVTSSDFPKLIAQRISSDLDRAGDLVERDSFDINEFILTPDAMEALGGALAIPIDANSVSGFQSTMSLIGQELTALGFQGASFEAAFAGVMTQAIKQVDGEIYNASTALGVLEMAAESGKSKMGGAFLELARANSVFTDEQRYQFNLMTDIDGLLAPYIQKQKDAARVTYENAEAADVLNEEFKIGNPLFEAAARELTAVEGAMKAVKSAQDALSGAPISYLEAGINMRDGLREMIDALNETGGEIFLGTKATDEALGTVKDAFIGIKDAALAAFAEAPEDPGKAVEIYTKEFANAVKIAISKGVDPVEIQKLISSNVALAPQLFAETLMGDERIYEDQIYASLDAATTEVAPELAKLGEGVGYDLAAGIIAGFQGYADTGMDSQANKFGERLIEILKDYFEIKSPSKLFARIIGVPLSQGIAQGIVDGAEQEESTIKKAMDIIIDTAKNAVDGMGSAISAQLDFAQATYDLAKFRNEMTLFAGQQEDAAAFAEQARFKFGGGTRVTAYERSQIEEAKIRADEARRAYQMGRGSYSAMVDAQFEYQNLVRDSKQTSEDLVKAQNDVLDANYNVNTASLQLMDAENGVASAFLDMVEAATELATQGQKARDIFKDIAAAAGLTRNAVTSIIGQAYVLAGPNLFGNMQLSDIFPGVDFGNLPKVPKDKGGGSDGGKGGNGGGKDEDDEYTDNPSAGTDILPGMTTSTTGKKKTSSISAQNASAAVMPPELFISRTTAKVGNKTALNAVTRTRVPVGYDGTMNNTNNFNITVNNPTPEPASDSIVRRTSAAANAGQFG